MGEILGRVDVALEGFAHPADRRGLAWNLRHFHDLTGLVEHTPNAAHRQLADKVFRLFEAAIVPRLDDLETQVIHGDYSPYNVVVDERNDDYVVGVIDFGDTMRSAVIFDPAVALANLVGRAPDQPWQDACAFVAGYETGAADQGPGTTPAPGRRVGTAHPARADHELARRARTRTARLPPGPCQG